MRGLGGVAERDDVAELRGAGGPERPSAVVEEGLGNVTRPYATVANPPRRLHHRWWPR
jgi:hypothetical protein